MVAGSWMSHLLFPPTSFFCYSRRRRPIVSFVCKKPFVVVVERKTMSITSAKYHLKVPSLDSLEHLLVQTVALLQDVSLESVAVVTNESSSGGVGLEQVVTNRLTRRTTSMQAVGWMGAVRMLTRANGLSDVVSAAQESWLEATNLTLVAVYKEKSTEKVFGAAVVDFVQHLEAHLIKTGGSYLVEPETLQIADVVVVTALSAVLQHLHGATVDGGNGKAKVPPKVHVWMTTVLQKACLDLLPFALIPGWRAFGVMDRRDVWKEWLELLEVGESAVPAPAAAAATAAPATAATPAPAPATTTETAAPTPEEAATSVPAAVSVDEDEELKDNAIMAKLKELGVEFEVYGHVSCSTAEDLVANVPTPNGESHTKNLFLRDKKHGHFLVTVRPDADVQTKSLGSDILKLTGKTNLRLADAAILDAKLHVQPGCVGPLCMALAEARGAGDDDKEKVTFILDRALTTQADTPLTAVHSHPLRNDRSVKMTPAVMEGIYAKLGVVPLVADFDKKSDSDAAGKAPANRPPESKQQGGGGEKKPKKGGKQAASDKKAPKKGETLLALQVKKDENFPQWYSDVITLSEMISYYDISGCYILRPWSYKMWELIQEWFNAKIQAKGVENAYFPLFVSQERLEKEKDHVEGFAPEVAWVTKSGDTDLAKQIAIRPTSETIMYPAYSDWIRSHRDLPLKLNQWSNVVRWEFKYPTPFLRTREFLWQEGHTAHATDEEADKMVMDILDLYRRVYEELLAVPVVPGYKTEKEKFAGGHRTTTVEAYVAGSGRAIQGATSHHLGQNFGKMFDISFQDEKGQSQIAWQTSWGLTTRTIGVMVMVHGDDTGLVLPPRIAPLQVVIVPILSKNFTPAQADEYCKPLLEDLLGAGVRAKYDDRELYNPGWKYNHWEQKGVPIRIEVGPRDVEKKSARIVIRHNGVKEDTPVEDDSGKRVLGSLLKDKLEEIQDAMFAKAKTARDSHLVQITDWKDFVPNLEKNNLVLTPWCGGEYQDWEETVKDRSREESLKARGEEVEDEKTATSVAAKTLCIPFDQPELPEGTKCFVSGLPAKCWILWGRSY